MNKNKCFTIGLKVIWQDQGKTYETKTHYDIDVAKAGELRSTWLLKNESNHYGHSTTDRRPQVKPITQVCIGDSFMIAVPIFTDSGLLIDPHAFRSIQILDYKLASIPDAFR